MKRKIYLFNQTSTAANYGIGRYIEQIIRLVKDTNTVLTVVELNSRKIREVTVTGEGGADRIIIPSAGVAALLPVDRVDSRYMRNVAYLLKEYVTDEENSLFHLNYMENEYLAIWLKKLFKVKIILTVHYTNWSFALLGDTVRLKKILNAKNREKPEPDTDAIVKSVERDGKIIEQCDRIICISQYSYNVVRDIYHADEGKMAVIPNGIKDDFKKHSSCEETEKLKEKYHLPENERIILFAGRLDEAKGICFLLNAFKKLITIHPNIRLIIAGDGNFARFMSDAIDICTKVTFTGRLERKELNRFYRMAVMGVQPSIHETFGYVAVEMMMHELPTVVTDTGGLSEIVEDRVTGLKIPVKTVNRKWQPDTNALYSGMKWMLEHPDEAKELGKQARKRFLKLYELSVWKRKMLEIYSEI